MINDKDRRGAYEGFYAMVLYIREGKVVARNGNDWNGPRSALCALPMRGAGLRGAVTGAFGK